MTLSSGWRADWLGFPGFPVGSSSGRPAVKLHAESISTARTQRCDRVFQRRFGVTHGRAKTRTKHQNICPFESESGCSVANLQTSVRLNLFVTKTKQGEPRRDQLAVLRRTTVLSDKGNNKQLCHWCREQTQRSSNRVLVEKFSTGDRRHVVIEVWLIVHVMQERN